MTNIILVSFGGALGATLRYLNSSLFKFYFPNFPYGTLFVNITGSFFIGLLMSFLENKNISETFIKYFIIIGVLGSYTTFSTFSFEVLDLFNSRKILLSIFYIVISIISCMIFVYLGYNFNKILI